MRKVWLGLVIALFVSSSAYADKKSKPPGKGFWKVLVQPNAKWTLRENSDPPSTLVIETYDVRKVGAADAARLRWTLIKPDGTKEDVSSTNEGRYEQVAVTPAGLYIMWKKMDDAKVAAYLENKPSRSDPPKPYKGTLQNAGRFLSIEDNGQVCYGQEQVKGDGCDDNCNASICLSATAGIVSVFGVYAPGNSAFTQDQP